MLEWNLNCGSVHRLQGGPPCLAVAKTEVGTLQSWRMPQARVGSDLEGETHVGGVGQLH